MPAGWGREDEFKRLFQAQMKRMTRDGLDTLVYIAIKDMAEVSYGCWNLPCVLSRPCERPVRRVETVYHDAKSVHCSTQKPSVRSVTRPCLLWLST